MKAKNIFLTALILYYIVIAIILFLGYYGKINPWLVVLQTIIGLAVFFIIIVLTQLLFSKTKSKALTIGFFDLILFALIFCLFMTIAELVNLSEDIFGYIALVLSILISLFYGIFFFRKTKKYDKIEFKNKASLNVLLISIGFTLLFLISCFMAEKLIAPSNNIFDVLSFKGFGLIISLQTGIAILLWSLGAYLMVRHNKKIN